MDKVVGQGRFRVDRRRALEKLERFQLEDPARYVLELVAAGVAAGAEAVRVTNDADDFVVEWSGDSLAPDVLETLFDYVFGEAEPVRQHLATGVLAALAIRPRLLQVDSGAWRLTVEGPVDTTRTPLEEPVDGVRVHVQERVGPQVVAEALAGVFGRPPAETHLVWSATRACHVPVVVNGQRGPRMAPRRETHARITTDDADVWLTGTSGPGRILLVRHGIVVDSVPIPAPQMGGWIRADELTLNASRSAVVEDAARNAVVRRLIDLRVALAQRARSPDLARLLIPWLAAQGADWTPLGDIACIRDLSDKVWTGNELAEATLRPALSDVNVMVPGVFGIDQSALVRAVREDTTVQSARYRAMRKGSERRYRARKREIGPRDGHMFRRGRLTGAIQKAMGQGNLVLDVLIDGTELCVKERASNLGRWRIVLDHPSFVPNLEFTDVVEDATWREAMEVVDEVVIERACRMLTDRSLAAMLRGGDPPDVMLDVPVLRRGDGQRISLRQADAMAGKVWVLTSPRGHANDGINCLIVDLVDHQLWQDRLRGRHVAELEAREEAIRRHELPRRQPVLRPPRPGQIDVEEPGLRGQIALGSGGIEVLKTGIAVATLPATKLGAGLVGVVEVPEARVNTAWDGLLEPDPILAALRPHVWELLDGVWRTADLPLPETLLRHIAEAADPATDVPVVATLGGQPLTLGDLADRSVDVINTVVDGEIPSSCADWIFETPGTRDVLERFAANRVNKNAEFATRHRRREAFLRKPFADPEGRLVDWTDEHGQTYYLPDNPDRIGLVTVDILHRGRELQRLDGLASGASTRAESKADPYYVAPREPELLHRLAQSAVHALPHLLEALGDFDDAHLQQATFARTWMRLIERVTEQRPTLLTHLENRALVRTCRSTWTTLAALTEDPDARYLPMDYSRRIPDHGEWVRLLPHVASHFGIRYGEQEAKDWEEAQRRLADAVALRPVLSGPQHARASLALSSLYGQVGIGSAWTETGLVIEAIHRGVLLEPLELPFPIRVNAIVAGDAVVPDARLASWKPADPGLLDDIRAKAVAVAERAARNRPAIGRRWVCSEHASDDVRRVRVFDCIDGSRTSFFELRAREHVQFVTIPVPVPIVPPPVKLTEREVLDLDEHLPLVRLDHLRRLASGQLMRGVHRIDWRGPGQVGIPLDGVSTGIQLRRHRVPLGALPIEHVLPLRGWIDDPRLVPDPGWTRIEQGLDVVLAEIVAAADAALEALAADNAPILRTTLLSASPTVTDIRASLPLFQTVDGREGTLADLLASPLFAPNIHPTQKVPGLPPIWRLTRDEVDWLRRHGVPVQDGVPVLLRLRDGWKRRRRIYVEPIPANAPVSISCGSLWLDEGPGSIDVVVDNALCCSLEHPELGRISGFVRGSWPTDEAFRDAEVPDAVVAEVVAAAKELRARAAGVPEWFLQGGVDTSDPRVVALANYVQGASDTSVDDELIALSTLVDALSGSGSAA